MTVQDIAALMPCSKTLFYRCVASSRWRKALDCLDKTNNIARGALERGFLEEPTLDMQEQAAEREFFLEDPRLSNVRIHTAGAAQNTTYHNYY